MKKWLLITRLIGIQALLCTSMAFAQANDPALPEPDKTAQTSAENTTAIKQDVPASQEVDITEDNYRQFMELKDERGQRNILPEDAFKSGSGLQKLDKLPEESQKHLRNQLREIIVQGEQWQPGDEDKDYPYVPSRAALTNQPLREQEAEAWGELVDGYHRREAQIHEISARTRAAKSSEDGSGGGAGSGSGNENASSGQGEGAGQVGEVQQDGQRQGSQADEMAGGYSPSGSSEPGSAGISQNAMEFLKGNAGRGDNAGEDSTESPAIADTTPASRDQSATREAESEAVAGTSQNAFEYLTEEGAQEGRGMPAEAAAPTGTLSIQDLLNAQGTLDATMGTSATGASDSGDPDKTLPVRNDKNGDGKNRDGENE